MLFDHQKPSVVTMITLLVSLLWGGCQKPQHSPSPRDADRSGSDLDFGFVRPPSYQPVAFKTGSVLWDIHLTGTVHVCLTKNSAVSNRENAISAVFIQVIKDWNRLLVDHPRWNHDDVQVKATWETACTRTATPGHIAVNFENLPQSLAGQATFKKRTMTLKTSIVQHESLAPFNKVYTLIAHEYGHLIGFSDVYDLPIGHPESAMDSLQVWPHGFSYDDRLAIHHFWEFLVGDTLNLCPKGYVETKIPDKNQVYCLENSKSQFLFSGVSQRQDWSANQLVFRRSSESRADFLFRVFQAMTGGYVEPHQIESEAFFDHHRFADWSRLQGDAPVLTKESLAMLHSYVCQKFAPLAPKRLIQDIKTAGLVACSPSFDLQQIMAMLPTPQSSHWQQESLLQRQGRSSNSWAKDIISALLGYNVFLLVGKADFTNKPWQSIMEDKTALDRSLLNQIIAYVCTDPHFGKSIAVGPLMKHAGLASCQPQGAIGFEDEQERRDRMDHEQALRAQQALEERQRLEAEERRLAEAAQSARAQDERELMNDHQAAYIERFQSVDALAVNDPFRARFMQAGGDWSLWTHHANITTSYRRRDIVTKTISLNFLTDQASCKSQCETLTDCNVMIVNYYYQFCILAKVDGSPTEYQPVSDTMGDIFCRDSGCDPFN